MSLTMTTVGNQAFTGRRAMFVVPILAGLSMIGPFSIDTPFPAFQRMSDGLDVATTDLQLVVSTYLIAFALMSPLPGPLSDALGRRRVIVVGMGVYVLASIGCALAPTLPVLLAFRVLQGLSAGAGMIVSRTVIRDVFDGPQAQRLMSRVMMIFAIAPAVAPIVGGGLLQVGSWRLVFWFMVGLGALLVLAVVVVLPETHPPERRVPLRFDTLAGTLASVVRHAAFHRVAWAAALSFAGQFLYIGAAPIFVVDLLGKGELDFWMLFVPMIAGVMLGAWISEHAAGRVSGRVLVTAALIVGLTGAVVNVLIACAPAGATVPWAVIGPSIMGIGTAAAYPTQQLTLLDMFPAARGASVSMFTFFTLLLNGVLATAITPIATRSTLALALASGALILAGFLLWLTHLRISPTTVATPPPEQVEPTESL